MNDRTDFPPAKNIVLSIVGALLCLLALIWLFQGNDFFLFKVWAPKYEAARRETFEQSKAYNDGMAQELRAMQLDHIKGTPDQKKAICSVATHRVSGFDKSRLSPDIRSFLSECEAGQGL